MKLPKGSFCASVVPPQKWKCFDDCPVCRLFKQSLLTGKEISGVKLEKAFTKAERESPRLTSETILE